MGTSMTSVSWAQQACKSTRAPQLHLCHSSISPSMSSMGTWELGCELLGGASERVTRSVGGTQSESIWASKGNAYCIAMSLACRRFVLHGTFTPRAPKQSHMRVVTDASACPVTTCACLCGTYQLGRCVGQSKL